MTTRSGLASVIGVGGAAPGTRRRVESSLLRILPVRRSLPAAWVCLAVAGAACRAGNDAGPDARSTAVVAPDADAALVDAGAVTDAAVDTAAGLADTSTALTDTGATLPDATTPVGCPGPTQPAADASWGDVPVPDAVGCAHEDPLFFKGAPPPAPTLGVEVGTVNAAGVFVPYQEGDWVPLVHGSQGGFHLWAGLRVKLPGSTVPKAKLQADMGVFAGCAQVSFGNNPAIYPERHADGSYVLGSAETPGLQMRFSADESGSEANSAVVTKFCNRWYVLRVAVRDVASQKWGAAAVRLRAYDTSVGTKK